MTEVPNYCAIDKLCILRKDCWDSKAPDAEKNHQMQIDFKARIDEGKREQAPINARW